MRTELFLKTSTQLVQECQARLTDKSFTLGTPEQYKAAINEAIMLWHGRVTLPKLYSFDNAFASGIYEYALPAHVAPPFDVQMRSHSYVYPDGQTVVAEGDDTNRSWQTVAGYSVEPTASGGWLLRLPMSPSSDAGRIIYWGQNGPMPTEPLTLAEDADATDTTIVVQMNHSVTDFGISDTAPNGWIRLRGEWLSYGDISKEPYDIFPTLTLSNCVRGLFGTYADNHFSGAPVDWGVGVDDQRLWINLYDYVTFFVHALQIHKGTSEDVSRHEKLVSFYEQKHMNFWRTQGYMSQRKASRLQTPQSLGAVAW